MSKVMQKMMESAAQQAMEITAEIFGISTEAVAKILQVGIPMQQKIIAESPEKVKELYKEAFALMPEEVQEFYRTLAEDEDAVEKIVTDYKAFMGASAEAINKAIADELEGVSEEDAGKAMAAMQPAAKEAIKEEAQAAGVEDVGAFRGWLQAEGEVN